jgi:sulfiredoxin
VARIEIAEFLGSGPGPEQRELLRLIGTLEEEAADVAGGKEIGMLKKQVFEIAKIHVPVKRAKTLDPGKVSQIAESILEEGQTNPIQVRADGERFVLVEGLHRLEALKALGERTVDGYLVQARKH